jgi:lipopolysaccharide transport system ATP-binding protein
MLALGAGFKPVLSGRENIVLNLSLLGVSNRDICERLDAIVDFAEIGDAIDAPIGTYSSGMIARLGFACAVHTEPQLLIVDEVLSVGDAKFRTKCRNRINELRKAGTAMLLVSHSAILIQALCDECVYLRGGLVAARGIPERVLGAYETDIVQSEAVSNAARVADSSKADTKGENSTISILEVNFKAAETPKNGLWITGKPAAIVLSMRCARFVSDISINVMISDLTHQAGETVQFMTSHRDIGWLRLDCGQPELRLEFPTVGLRPGTYRVKISVSQGPMHDILDVIEEARVIVRDAGLGGNCLYFQPREWKITGGVIEDMPALQAVSE